MLQCKLSNKQKRNYSLDVMAGVKFLHDNKVAHRDIKPDNFLVSKHDKILLSDFGESVNLDGQYRIQKIGLSSGNFQHMAPDVTEQFNGAEPSTWICFASNYSWEVGCIIYTICCGEFPFPNYHNSMQVSLSFDDSTSLTPEFRQLLTRALDPSGERRLPFVEFYEKLQTVRFFV
mmetsp:Transcript_12426/g.19606  ORF Transcript_12426/g.19606 Transcript_12426/m.19606 type:complete len:175 (+) Transcript_12426:100-624(+)